MGEVSGSLRCPGCHQPTAGMTQLSGGKTFVVGEDADVLCFHCGEIYIITMTAFGFVSRMPSAEEREEATRRDLLNFVRTHYAEYRDRNPEVFRGQG